MNFSICKKNITLLAATLFSITFSVYAQDIEIQQPLNPEIALELQNNYVELQLKNILAYYNSVDMILEDLSLIISNGQLHKIKNQKEVIESIKQIRSLISTVANDAYTEINPASLYMLLKILDQVVTHIQQAVKKGCIPFPPFDVQNHITRIMRMEVDFEQFESDMHDVSKKIEALDNQAKSAGLTWYNKVYRKIDDYVIQPSIKYRIFPRTGKVLLGASILFFLWFHTERGTRPENEPTAQDARVPLAQDDQIAVLGHISQQLELNNRMIEKMGQRSEAFKSAAELLTPDEVKIATELDDVNGPIAHLALPHVVPAPKKYFAWEYWLRDLVGPYPHYIGASNTLNTAYHIPGGKNALKNIGNLTDKLIMYNHGHMAIGALLISWAPSMFSNEIRDAKEWVTKKITALHYKLKGGIYRKQAEETEHKIEPKITFDDLIGLDHAKEILSFIVKYIEDPERWVRGGLEAHKGYLLTGPTRSGKSYIAEALAGEIKKAMKNKNKNPDEFNFYVIKAATINQLGIGEVLRLARNEAPCVIFIDEIDLLSLQRAGGNTTLLNDFLTSLSGCLESSDPKKQVIILAATNKPENLDGALKQPGRFGKEIRFEYPSLPYRKLYLEKKLNKLAVNLQDFDLDKIAIQTEGCSFKDLDIVVTHAFQQSKIKGHSITQEKLDESLDSEIRNIIMSDQKVLPQHELKMLAAHQAGHTLATYLLSSQQKIAKVTIRPIQNKLKEESVWQPLYDGDESIKQKPIEYGKLFTYCEHDTIYLNTYEEKIHAIKIHLAGHIAEEILLQGSSYAYHQDDKQHALNIAKSITFEGLKPDKISKKLHNKLFDQAYELVSQAKKDVMQLLKNHQEKLKQIADALEQKMTLDSTEIEQIMKA